MKRASWALIAAAALAAGGCSQNAQMTDEEAPDAAEQTVSRPAPERAPATAPARAMIKVPKGTIVALKLRTDLNSGQSRVGDPFTAVVTEDVVVDGKTAILAGSKVRGSVTEVVPAKRGAGNASLTMRFDQLEPTGSDAVDIVASLSDQSDSKKKRNAAIIGGSAAGGALLGRIIGKDTKGAVVGAVVGGAIGTGVVMSKEGEQVNLPSGTEMDVKLERAIQVQLLR